MASAAKIGVQIGVEDYDKFSKTISKIRQDLRETASEIKKITSAFSEDGRTIKQNTDLRNALNKSLEQEKSKLREQQEALKKLAEARSNLNENDKDYAKNLDLIAKEEQRYRTSANNTQTEINKLNKQLESLPSNIKMVADAWKNASSDTGEVLKGIGDTLTKYVTLPIIGFGGVSLKTAADFESAFTGVKKTVDGTAEQLEILKEELMEIPLVTASSTEQVMAVAEAAGQLNVPIEQIAEFTKYVIMLGDSTNITAEEGATSIARFMNIMGVEMDKGVEDVDRFGAALVALGNNTATDEASILSLAMRLASAGKFAGMTIPEILGLSAAMSSVGLTAEAGGTAMSTTIQKITMAVAEGGDILDKFAQVAGTTSEAFAEKWRTKPVEALQELLIGMAHLEGGGEELIQFMDEVGWSGIRQSDTMRRLTLDYNGLVDAVALANDEFVTNEESLDGVNALTEEATKRYQDFNSIFSEFKESVRQLAAAFGEVLLPVLKPIVESARDFFKTLSEMDEGTKNLIITLAGILAATGPLIGMVGRALIFITQVKTALGVLGITMASIGTAFTTVILPIAGFIAAIVAVYEAIKHASEIRDFFTQLWDALGEKIKHDLEQIKEWLKSFVDGLLSGLLSFLEDMAANLILFALVKVPEWLGKFAHHIMENFRKAKESGVMQTHALFDQVSNIFSNLVSSAWSWGKDLIGNLISGIKSKISSLVNAVSDVASRIWSYLHFSEPEKGALANFHTWMPDMMRSMAEGIEDNMYLVDNAIGRVADTLGMGGTTNNYGGVVINLNVPQGANGQQIVDEIETELANRTMRRKAVFG